MIAMTHTDTLSELLTLDEVAEALRCSKTHVYRLIRGDHLKAVDISAPGSTRAKSRVRKDDLAHYINKATQG